VVILSYEKGPPVHLIELNPPSPKHLTKQSVLYGPAQQQRARAQFGRSSPRQPPAAFALDDGGTSANAEPRSTPLAGLL
jgi:hypothetical protein